MSRNMRFVLALLVLTLFLGSGAAHALPAEGRDADRGSGMLAAVWEWVTSLLEAPVSLLGIHEATETVAPTAPNTSGGGSKGDFGGYIDPNG